MYILGTSHNSLTFCLFCIKTKCVCVCVCGIAKIWIGWHNIVLHIIIVDKLWRHNMAADIIIHSYHSYSHCINYASFLLVWVMRLFSCMSNVIAFPFHHFVSTNTDLPVTWIRVVPGAAGCDDAAAAAPWSGGKNQSDPFSHTKLHHNHWIWSHFTPLNMLKDTIPCRHSWAREPSLIAILRGCYTLD